jgi:hypothetical protein
LIDNLDNLDESEKHIQTIDSNDSFQSDEDFFDNEICIICLLISANTVLVSAPEDTVINKIVKKGKLTQI